jgi:hypothetical protein
MGRFARSDAEISKAYQIDEKSINRSRKEMVKLGLIEFWPGKPGVKSYYLVHDGTYDSFGAFQPNKVCSFNLFHKGGENTPIKKPCMGVGMTPSMGDKIPPSEPLPLETQPLEIKDDLPF